MIMPDKVSKVPSKRKLEECIELDEDPVQEKGGHVVVSWPQERKECFFWVLDKYLGCVMSSSEFTKYFDKCITSRFWEVVSLSDLSFLFYSLLWNYDKAKKIADLVNNEGISVQEARKQTSEKNGKKNVGDKQKRMELYNSIHKKIKGLKFARDTVIAKEYKDHRHSLKPKRGKVKANAASPPVSHESLQHRRVYDSKPIPAYELDTAFLIHGLGVELWERHQNLIRGNIHSTAVV